MKLFWSVLTVACVVWYSVVTFYVAVRGVGDIRQMLSNLSNSAHGDSED